MNSNHCTAGDTIIARCTPQGSGALALIRISGSNACFIANTFCVLPSSKEITAVPSHTVHYARIQDTRNNQALVDTVLVIVMHGPKTFTGEDVVEITCHNNPFIVDQIINLAIAHGARLARPGEFAQRAVENGKIDLVQAEAINELIHAHTQEALRQSLAQVEGSFSHWIHTLEQRLITCLAYCESSFEFIDEELEFADDIKRRIDTIIADITLLKKSFNQQRQLREGARVALIGSVNAGKSSLFNALIGSKRAIVTDQAGTTRDTIEAQIYTQDTSFTLIDTAGLRETDNTIEQEGIRRSLEAAQLADVILLVYDASRELSPQEAAAYQTITRDYNHKIITVYNKSDQLEPHTITDLCSRSDHFAVSAQIGTGIKNLEQAIGTKIHKLMSECNAPFILNQRQTRLISSLENALIPVQQILSGRIEYELLAIHLRDALQVLGELSGKTVSERAMDAVFREFCVGK